MFHALWDFYKHQKNIIYSPIKGKIIPLSEVNDPIFSEKMVGEGLAIIPFETMVKSPVNGVVEAFLPSMHAIGIKSENGTDVMIHVGLDTVDLKGRYFHRLVKKGEYVKIGQNLITFEKENIESEGYDTVTMVLVTNIDQFKTEQLASEYSIVSSGDKLIKTYER